MHALESMDTSKVHFIKEKYEFDEINNLEKFDYSYEDECESKNSGDYNQVKKKFSLNNFLDNEHSYEGSFTEQEKILIRMYRNSFKYGFHEMDKLLARGQGETSKVRWSGTTACCCIIEKIDSTGWIHIANCGNTKKLNFKNNKIFCIFFPGDVEAILVINTAKSAKKLNRNHKVLTTLHTLNECIKDRNSLEKRGKFKSFKKLSKKISKLYLFIYLLK